jgi:hypothetical protein
MGFNSAFKGLNSNFITSILLVLNNNTLDARQSGSVVTENVVL